MVVCVRTHVRALGVGGGGAYLTLDPFNPWYSLLRAVAGSHSLHCVICKYHRPHGPTICTLKRFQKVCCMPIEAHGHPSDASHASGELDSSVSLFLSRQLQHNLTNTSSASGNAIILTKVTRQPFKYIPQWMSIRDLLH